MMESIPNLNEARLKIVYPQIADLPYAAQEAVNILRGNLQLSGKGIQAIAVTSASKEEGKSSVAIQLTKSFAALNKAVVYVDCDIRKSKTLRRYQINEQVVGLTEYLSGNCRLENIVYRTDNPNMDMVFTGAAAPNPSELLSDMMFEQFLEILKANYDYVIVDTPPINAVIDGAIVAKSCDASPKQLLFKRVMDIAGGLVGCLLTVIIFIFVAPIIYISSPGPIFFSQERIGKNGKKFKIYKFRSMYMDAEARKAELMKQNRVADGKMFKLDFDPRVIGNKILPDGTKKTGVGNFIRVTSLDEFPQFFNVLKGDMSLVGTRPPLPGEVSEYEIHHRARLAIKPGITGMWQVSGRSDITDFEEVVRLDTKYIKEWTPALDIKILFKTVKTVLGKEGSM